MICAEAKPLINPYADGELDTTRILDLEAHLRGCPACTSALRNVQGVKNAVKHQATYFTAPAELRRNIRAELRAQTGEKESRPFWQWNWFTFATSGFAVACLAILLVVMNSRPSGHVQLAQEVVSSHFRSLQANHLYDVASSDQHTVKPWFTGKVDFGVPVKDFDQFPLAGGRLDYINGRTVAALVFERHKHKINLFIWPTKEGESVPAPVPSVNGYNLIHWVHDGMDCWAVSDLGQKELLTFAQMYVAAN